MRLIQKIINLFKRKTLQANNTRVFINNRELSGILSTVVSKNSVYINHVCIEKDHWYNTKELLGVRVVTSDSVEVLNEKMVVKNWTLKINTDDVVRLELFLGIE